MRPAGTLQIAPSLLSADFAALGEAIAQAERGGADLIHVDIMDGHFVPNITIGPPVVKALKRVSRLPLDVHLMIEDPDRYIEAFVSAGAASVDRSPSTGGLPPGDDRVVVDAARCSPSGWSPEPPVRSSNE